MRAASKSNTGTALAQGGFSLIEFIGVLTILTLIAAAAGPTFIKRLDYEAKTKETTVLASLSKALLEGCVASNQIPNAANIPASIAQVLNMSTNHVKVNGRGFTRLFITHPDASINGLALPYSQGANGSASAPANAQAVIVSTIANALPGIAPTAAEFDEMWIAPAGTIPSVLSSWGGRGEDLLIERVNFAPLFWKVILKNLDPLPDSIPNKGFYSLETNATNYVAPGVTATAYCIDGTMLTLFRSDGVTNDTRQILHSDVSFLYQNHKWTRQLQGSDEVVGPFGELASEFIKPPAPTDPEFGATQQAVLNTLYSFLWAYGNWAYGDTGTITNSAGVVKSPAVAQYEGASSPNAKNYPNYVLLEEAQVNLKDFTLNLIQ